MDTILTNLLGENVEVICTMPTCKHTPTYTEYLETLSAECGYTFITDYAKRIHEATEDGTLKNRYAEMLCEAQQDYKKLTELVLLLNWFGWYYDDIKEYAKSAEVLEYWGEADELGFEVLKGEELNYFIQTLD